MVLALEYTYSTWAWSRARNAPTFWFAKPQGTNSIRPSWVSAEAPADRITRGIDVELRRPDGTLEYLSRSTYPDLGMISAPVLDVRCDTTHPCLGTWELSAIAFDADGVVRSVRTISVEGRDVTSATRPSLVSFARVGPRVRHTRVAPNGSKQGKYPWYGVPLKFKAVFSDPDRLLAMYATEWDEVDAGGPEMRTRGTWKGSKVIRTDSAVERAQFNSRGRTVLTLEPLFSDARYGCHQVWFTRIPYHGSVKVVGSGAAVKRAASSVCVERRK